MRFLTLIAAFLVAATIPAFAVPPPVPEPVSMSLLAVGIGGAAVVRALRNKRRK